MSIILGLLKLHVEGTLVPYKPTIIKPDHPEGGRTLWLTPDTEMWCQPPGDHPDNRIDDETLAVVGDQLNAFARGDFMEMKVDIQTSRSRHDRRLGDSISPRAATTACVWVLCCAEGLCRHTLR